MPDALVKMLYSTDQEKNCTCYPLPITQHMLSPYQGHLLILLSIMDATSVESPTHFAMWVLSLPTAWNASPNLPKMCWRISRASKSDPSHIVMCSYKYTLLQGCSRAHCLSRITQALSQPRGAVTRVIWRRNRSHSWPGERPYMEILCYILIAIPSRFKKAWMGGELTTQKVWRPWSSTGSPRRKSPLTPHSTARSKVIADFTMSVQVLSYALPAWIGLIHSKFLPELLRLIPLIFFRIREKLCSGEMRVRGDQWPLFLYANLDYDSDDPWKGLLRGHLLVSVSCLIPFPYIFKKELCHRPSNMYSPHRVRSMRTNQGLQGQATPEYTVWTLLRSPPWRTSPHRYALSG